jgi:AcrR family transcriptional regulator
VTRDRLRSRFPGRIRDEVKEVALRQLAEHGPDALSINAIARELDVSGPALYRYFAGRDELLTALIIDAYGDLARALAQAAARGRGRSAETRLRALARAYRAWAVEQPHRYRLMFRPLLPGYDAHTSALVDAAQPAMSVVLDVLSDIPAEGRRSPTAPERELAGWIERRDIPTTAAPHALQAIVLWSRLHGLASLEIDGNYASIGIDPAPLYASEVATVLEQYRPAAGGSVTRPGPAAPR